MVYGRIYKAEFPNGKMYVGATVLSIKVRSQIHISSAKRGERGCPAFHSAIRKHGEPVFSEVCVAASQEELDVAEKLWINEFGTMVPRGYNIKEGGQTGRHSEATKNKMSQSRLGKKMPPRTPEQCLKYARHGEQNHNFGKPRSEDTKRKIGAAQKGEKNHRFGKKWDTEHLLMFREKQSGEENGFFGKTHSGSSKDMMSDRKRKLSDSDVRKIRELYNAGDVTQSSLSTLFSVHPSVISRVINDKRRCYADAGRV